MIAQLTGTLIWKSLDRLIVDVNGVGYQVSVSAQTLADLPAEGQRVVLRCYTHVREDTLQLFGFASAQEQRAFELLILVSGVGPRLALTVLSGMPAAELARAIAASNHEKLQTIPGVGRKTAERLVVELQDRFARFSATETADSKEGIGTGQDVVDALVNLGYKRPQAEKAVRQQLGGKEQLSPEILLRRTLASMQSQEAT